MEVPSILLLTIQLKRGEASNPRICIYKDGNNATETSMTFTSAYGSYDAYEAELSISEAGLYWYHFKFDVGEHNTIYVPEHAGGAFQITAYNKPTKTPDWLHGGIIYHIFVDRFYGDGQIRLGRGATHRADWGGCPYFLPDENGIVHNSDFFGGNLYGVIEKLPYLEEMGVNCIYLSPVFEALSNHKYDTSDYMKVDDAFGGDEALELLCKEASKHGMRVILDGVFNHVGSDSIYFNRYGHYDTVGAYQDENSPYRDWFTFNDDGTYEAWWGIELLPALNKHNKQYIEFLCGKDGVIEHWMKKGVAGWRLDVVDEIPDILLDPLCKAMKDTKDDTLIVGEVWEDASNKIAYSVRRRYFQGGQLDSVTNYPLKDAIIACVKDGDVARLAYTVDSLCRNYPKNVLDSLMNILGTHDTMRILTALGGSDFPPDRPGMSQFKLSENELYLAKKRLKLASALQFTLPGVPCVYYGDEAGMEGGADPFCRICYPWGNEDNALIEWYQKLAKIRKEYPCFKDGEYTLVEAMDGLFAFTRGEGKSRILIAINVSDYERVVTIKGFNTDLINNAKVSFLIVQPLGVGMFKQSLPAKKITKKPSKER